VRSPPPWTHYLDTQPLASPSISRQLALVVPTARYSLEHLYEDRGDGKNNLRSFALWQLAAARALGPLGLAAAGVGTAALLAVGVFGFGRLRRAHARLVEVDDEVAAIVDGDGSAAAGFAGYAVPASPYAGGENLEAMEAADNYNRFLAEAVLAVTDGSSPVLDFGAGTGTHARALRERGVDVRCVEPDPVLRERLEREGFASTASIREFAPESFGVVYSLNVLEHIDDDGEAVRGVFDATRRGGAVVLYVPAFGLLHTEMDRLVGHVRRYRRPELVSLAEAAGFRVTRCRYVDSLGFLAALLYRVLGASGRLSPAFVGAYDRFVFPVSRVIDRATSWWFGKNLLLEAYRD
jgi:SAM-dependent methyltransferase